MILKIGKRFFTNVDMRNENGTYNKMMFEVDSYGVSKFCLLFALMVSPKTFLLFALMVSSKLECFVALENRQIVFDLIRRVLKRPKLRRSFV